MKKIAMTEDYRVADNSGNLSVNMTQMPKWKVTEDNVKFYDKVMGSKGKFYTLDSRPYQELLNEFNIFYTLSS